MLFLRMKSFFLSLVALGSIQALPQEVLAKPEDSVIIDVRTPGEFKSESIVGALNIDIYDSQFEAQIKKLDKSKTYLLYCRSGSRSGQAQMMMRRWGYQKTQNLGSLGQARSALQRQGLVKK